MKLTPEERHLTAHILDMYVDTLIELTDKKKPTPAVVMCLEEMLLIKSIFGKIEEDIKLEETQNK
jgi:hypothetical protein